MRSSAVRMRRIRGKNVETSTLGAAYALRAYVSDLVDTLGDHGFLGLEPWRSSGHLLEHVQVRIEG